MAKVLMFSKKQPFHEFLDELREMYDKDLANNFVCIYSRNYKKDEEEEGFIGRNVSYWFGKSCSECLGLLRIMDTEILDYIREQNEEVI